jgi:hypothetical protein
MSLPVIAFGQSHFEETKAFAGQGHAEAAKWFRLAAE